MRYVASYLLAVLGGNEHPSVADIENILGAVGIDADGEKAKLVVSKLKGKTISELIAEGSKHLVSVSGGGGASAAPATGGSAPAAASAPAEEKKKKEEPKEESDDDMGFGLFD
ncbi:unnamed protein product, partial [Mesorhabditis belari]|uniref:Large ribosomal subunit protein P2 n=1 Tax=Mesorhabditis belari TaxID=2138241 RepID=A0AAF3FMZ5_9BILA